MMPGIMADLVPKTVTMSPLRTVKEEVLNNAPTVKFHAQVLYFKN
jgi:hypothetical protein